MGSKADALGHSFSDSQLLEQALTHRSAGRCNNERLEFLGDALLNLIVAEFVFEQYPRASEGDMTRARASLVNGAALAELAREAQIGEQLVLGPGELKTGGFRRESILADTFEALVAAVYLDAGWERCRTLVRSLFYERVMAVEGKVAKDPKTLLQELLQANSLPLPEYQLTASHGDDHDKVFEVDCRVEALALTANGHGSSRRSAEQAAALALLDQAQAAMAIRKKGRKA
ncbi:MAG: ribonuclease III [Xanthomonadales bacterium]|nr:ribonuclease III [Xanthomonadales bacterium]